MNTNLGSGGTHIDTALNSVNALISGGTGAVGDGSTSTTPQPYVFLVTDGAQDNQIKGVPNGNWHGSNRATVLNDPANAYPNACKRSRTAASSFPCSIFPINRSHP